MNADDILTRTFAEHEDLAPSAQTLLADLRRHLDSRRRRNTVRALSTLAAAAAVAAVAIGITAVSGDHDSSAPAAGSHSAAAPTAPTSAPPATSTPPAGPATTFVLGIRAGWLPGPTSGGQVFASTSSTSHSRDYLVRDGHADLDVEVGVDRSRELPGRQKDLAPTPVTVGGKPGVEYAKQGFYELVFRTGDGPVASVYLNPHQTDSQAAEYSAAALTRIGRHIARDLRFGGTELIKTSAVLTYLPDGVMINEVGTIANGVGGTTYTLHTAGGTRDAQVMIGGTESGVGGNVGKPAKPVQGHRTRVAHYPSGYDLVVYGFRPGVSVSVTSGDGVTTLAQLYRIADGIRFGE